MVRDRLRGVTLSGLVHSITAALLFALVSGMAEAQTGNWGSTKAQQEYAKALTAATFFGMPRYTTALLPTCGSTNTGALAFDTTVGNLKACDGGAWILGGTGTSIAPITVDNTGAGNGAMVVLKTMSGSSFTSNFFSLTGTMPSSLSASTAAISYDLTGAGSSAQAIWGQITQLKAGFTGNGASYAVYGSNASAGVQAGSGHFAENGNFGGLFKATGTGSVVNNTGVSAVASGSSTTNVGLFGGATSATGTPANNIGVIGYGLNGSAINVGVAGVLASSVATTALRSAAGYFDNGAAAAPVIIAADNSAALPTTGATATWQILDGAWPQVGNGVLTSGTMTAETQARDTGSMIHSYTWTNAQVVALGATTAGDISVATLPAKTVVKNAYVVILTAAGTVTTLTVACGRTSATYIDYIVASDAKAAANTVYGDASAERGTNLTGYDLPSYTGTTAVNCHFISTGGNLNTVTTSTGRVILETSLVP